jgi:hypothetical protein
MTALLIAALALASPDYDLSWKGGMSCADGDCTLPGDTLSFDCNTCPCLIYQESETTDAHGCGITMHAGHAFGTSKDGGDLTLCGGDTSHSIATTAAIAAGDSVYIYIDGVLVATLVEGVAADFDCSGTDDTCAASLCAAIEAQSGVSCSGSTSPINPQVDADKCTVGFASADGAADGEFAVDTTGDVGSVLILARRSDANALPLDFMFRNDPDTGFRSPVSNYWYVVAGGQVVQAWSTTGTTLTKNLDTLNNRIYSSNSYVNLGPAVTNAHGLTTTLVGTGGSFVVNGDLYNDGAVYAGREADLSAGACTPKDIVVDTGGATRELCRCNDAGTAYDCISVTTTNGPTD